MLILDGSSCPHLVEVEDLDNMADEYIPYCPYGPYAWVVIEYNGHFGFFYNWQDCLEGIFFIDGYLIKENYIFYNDPKLTYYEPIMVKNVK